jgi:SAM-dependent methyltransferase
LDLSPLNLEEAGKEADAAGVNVEWVQSDMRSIPFWDEFDAVINLFSSFGYLETEEEDLKVLQQVSKSLKSDGVLLFDTTNRDYVLSWFRPREWNRSDDDALVLEERELDYLSSQIRTRFIIVEADGRRWESPGFTLRWYTLTEFNKMLRQVGMTIQRVYGGFDGQEYSRDTRRMIVLARKDG